MYDVALHKYDKAEKRILCTRYAIIFLCIALTIFISPISKLFSYEVTEEITEKEPYQYTVGTISTYICYTTEYGECYHAEWCGSLWNSSYKTTVYKAEKRGYRPCSKCTPDERTELTLTETRYRDVIKEETVTRKPSFLVWLCGICCLIVTYFILTIVTRKHYKEAETQMQQKIEVWPPYH